MYWNSLNIKQKQLNKLKDLFPEVFSEDKILEATLGENVYINNERYVLNWDGKSNDVEEMLSIKQKIVIMLDRLFENNDQLKTNTFLQFKDAGVDFRTV